jgi:hypothetical protein
MMPVSANHFVSKCKTLRAIKQNGLLLSESLGLVVKIT